VTLGRGKGHVRLPYDLLVKLPIINGALDLRYSLLMYAGIAAVIAIGLDTMRREGIFTGIVRARPIRSVTPGAPGGPASSSWSPDQRRGRTWACLGIALVALLPLVPKLPYASTPVVVPTLFTAANSPLAKGDVVLSYPLAISYQGPLDQALLWQAASQMRFKLIAFRGAVAGPNHQPIRGPKLLLPPFEAEVVMSWGLYGKPNPPRFDAATSKAIRVFLMIYHVDAVTIVPTREHTARVIAYFKAALGVPPMKFAGSYIWPMVQQDLLHAGAP
jgi:hypothetical protein